MGKNVKFEDYQTIVKSNLFDEDWYLNTYPEVINSDFDPIFHYLVEGADNGYNPNPNFDTNFYLEKNGDVKNAGINPFVHYIKYGKNENRPFSPYSSLLFNNSQVTSILKHIHNKISIIVPVYNAYDETKECIESVLKNTHGNYELILIDDCSPDPRIEGLLNSYSKYNQIKVMKNEINKGFTGTVNVGLLNSGNNDVILLNSDTEVTSKWLTKLIIAAYSNDKIGSVTPVANNSGAFSVPNRETPNEIPDSLGVTGMGNLVEKVSKHVYMEVPTGNGFCMYIKRQTINDVGLFDEANFEKGYGEENDYSRRAVEQGWTHIIDDSTYIYHKEGASFSEKKLKLLKEHLTILDMKYPNYNSLVQDFITSEDLIFIENNVQKGMDNCSKKHYDKRRILYVMHMGGGTQRTLEDLAKNAYNDLEVYFLTSTTNSLILFHYNGEEFVEIDHWDTATNSNTKNTFIPEFRDIYFNILKKYGIDLLHIHHLIYHTWDIVYISKLLEIPIILSLHDFYLICPSYTLLDENMEFCGGVCPNTSESCTVLLPEFINIYDTKGFINKWRQNVSKLFKNIDYFITTNDYVKDLFINIYPELIDKKFRIIEHGEDFPELDGEYHSLPSPNEPIKILFLGNISVHKGLFMIKKLKECDVDSRLEFHFLGAITEELEPLGYYHGKYHISELPEYLKTIKPSYIGIFSIWPETFCYTLSESWNYRIPVLSFDMGVVGDRMRENKGGWFIDQHNMEDSYNKILKISNDLNEYNSIQNNLKNIHLKTTKEMSESYLKIYKNIIDNNEFGDNFVSDYLDINNCVLANSELPERITNFIPVSKIKFEDYYGLKTDEDIINQFETTNPTIIKAIKKILELELFDFIWYLSEYPDVKNAGVNPLVHYIKYGCNENRNPSEKFNNKEYYDSHPEVKQTSINPLIHYVLNKYDIK